jgi:maltoporin
MYGPEQPSNNSNNRFLLDIVSTIAVAKNLSLILNVDYGTEEGQGLNGTDANWKGIAGIIKYDYSDKYGLAVRGEYFDDTDGVRTGTAQEVKEFTITAEIKLSSGLIIRPEYRHDWSTSNFFNGSTKKSQDTIALGVMYKF